MDKFGDFKKHKTAITTNQLEELLTLQPRRHRLIDPAWHNLSWQALRPPMDETADWCLTFPFYETFGPAFEEFCNCHKDNQIEKLPFLRNDGTYVNYTYFKDPTLEQLNSIREWLTIIGSHVGIKDFLRISFALDYTREGGKPGSEFTEIATLRKIAKLYGNSDKPTTETLSAAGKLAEKCVKFLTSSRSYNIDSVLAIPRSTPSKSYNLPGFFANTIANELNLIDLSRCLQTTTERREMKDTPACERLAELEGTIGIIKPKKIEGKRILIIDDLYQSGTTMNYVGMLLLNSGASCISGLSCEKTCSNKN